jgi:hypothetical protein
MPTRVNLPDGRIVNFPDGMDTAAIEAEVSKLVQPAAPQEAPPEEGDQLVENVKNIGRFVTRNLPAVGGVVGGFLGGIPGAAAGGVIGSRGKQYVDAATGTAPLPPQMDAVKQMGKDAVTQAVAETGGRVISGGLRMLGRGLYRAGALPLVGQTGKYGDLVKAGVENNVPVTKGGVIKATNLRNASKAAKDAAVAAADSRASIPTDAILRDVSSDMADYGKRQVMVGKANPSSAVADRATAIRSANGPGMKPSQVEQFKSTLDDELGGAYEKLRKRNHLSAEERLDMGLSQSAGRAQESVVPGYREMNAKTMQAEGLRKMIARRLQGNQGLENAMTAAALPMGGPGVLAARTAMLPSVLSTAGIGVDMAGRQPAFYTNTLRAALADWLEKSQQ